MVACPGNAPRQPLPPSANGGPSHQEQRPKRAVYRRCSRWCRSSHAVTEAPSHTALVRLQLWAPMQLGPTAGPQNHAPASQQRSK